MNTLEEYSHNMTNRMQKGLETIQFFPNVTLVPEVPTWTKDLFRSLDIFNISTQSTNNNLDEMSKKVQKDLDKIGSMTNMTLVNPFQIFNLTNLNVTNLDIFRKVQADLDKMKNELTNPFNIFNNVTTNLNKTQKLPNDFANMQLLPNITWNNIFNGTHINITNLDIFNVTKKIQTALDSMKVFMKKNAVVQKKQKADEFCKEMTKKGFNPCISI